MSNVRRVYVEKKPDFAVKAKELKHEIKHYLGITTVEAVRVLIRYDVEIYQRRHTIKPCIQFSQSRLLMISMRRHLTMVMQKYLL